MRGQFVEEGMLERFAQRYPLRGLVLQHARDEIKQLSVLFAIALLISL
jgi:hypothetical protein